MEDAEAGAPQSEEKTGFGAPQIIATVLTLAVLVVVFAVVLPQFGDYRQAWDAIQDTSTGWIIALIAATGAAGGGEYSYSVA